MNFGNVLSYKFYLRLRCEEILEKWRTLTEFECLFFFHFDYSLQLNEFKGIFDIKCASFSVIFSVLWNIKIQNLFSGVGIYTIF